MSDDHSADHDDPGYTGPATLLLDGTAVEVEVDLRGSFQPIDGRFHWYGRVAADPELTRLVRGNRASATLRAPGGERPCELSEPDMWDRFRITGEGRPPFPSGLELPEHPDGEL
jgi:hypothetical protein